jgi:hypothetical protein
LSGIESPTIETVRGIGYKFVLWKGKLVFSFYWLFYQL